eukprot:GHVS01045458.1.p4 GENE.GHVS01045458.1~~GHVS01045458.1.p4  ORF type:complete len:116 (-),score=12.18 GHVS01045458.1:320-667(-)
MRWRPRGGSAAGQDEKHLELRQIEEPPNVEDFLSESFHLKDFLSESRYTCVYDLYLNMSVVHIYGTKEYTPNEIICVSLFLPTSYKTSMASTDVAKWKLLQLPPLLALEEPEVST